MNDKIRVKSKLSSGEYKKLLKSASKRSVTGNQIFAEALFKNIRDNDKANKPIENWSVELFEKQRTTLLNNFDEHLKTQLAEIITNPKLTAEGKKKLKAYNKLQYYEVELISKNFNDFMITSMKKYDKATREGLVDLIRSEAYKYNDETPIKEVSLPSYLIKITDDPQNSDVDSSIKGLVAALSHDLPTKLADAVISKEYKINPSVSKFPTQSLETTRRKGKENWKGYTEISPLDHEYENEMGWQVPDDVLINAMEDIAKELKIRGYETWITCMAVIRLWLNKKNIYERDWAEISLDDICSEVETRGKRKDQKSDRYQTTTRDLVRLAVERSARIKINMQDVPDKYRRQRDIDDPVIVIRNRSKYKGSSSELPENAPRQLELGSNIQKWDTIEVQPGKIMLSALDEWGMQTMLLPTSLNSQLDSKRDRKVILLGYHISKLFRVRAREMAKHHLTSTTFRVARLLEYADIELDKNSEKTLIKFLDKLKTKTLGVIADYEFKNNTDENLTSYADYRNKLGVSRLSNLIIKKWANDTWVEIELPMTIYNEYKKIGTKLQHKDKKQIPYSVSRKPLSG
jgi:hypothetical protein